MESIQSLLQKLKPFYPESEQHKLNKIWTLYQTSDWDRKKELEEFINKLAVSKGFDVVDERIVLPPPPEANTGGDISIGDVTYLDKQLFEYKLKLSELTRHTGIFGSTGTGKTTLARLIVRSLVKSKIPFIIFDWEQSYRGLIKESPEIKLFTIGKQTAPLQFNFFKVPPGIDYTEYVKNVIEVFSKAYVGGVGSDTILKRIFDTAYSMNKMPMLQEVKAILDSSMRGKYNMRGREMLWKQSAMRMIEFMNYGSTGKMYNVDDADDIEPLFNDYVIFELGGLANSNDKRFFTEIITLWYTLYLEHKGIEDERLKHVLLFEEFHNIVENSKKDDLIQKIFRSIRKYGTGMIALDQTPSQIPNSIFENMGTKITFSLDHAANVKAVANAMFMDKDQQKFIGLLKIGQAIVRSKERHPYPFLVTVPFAGKLAHVSDQEIKEHMKPFLQLSIINRQEQSRCPPLQPSPGYEYHPTGGEIILLQEIVINPYLGTDERYRKLGLSSRQGTELKQKLVDNGYLVPAQVDRKKLFELTKKARNFLAVKNIKIPPQSRGGIEHNYWLEKIKEHFKKKSFTFKEKDNIDLVVIHLKGTEEITTAIQVETGKSNIKKNIETLLRQNCNTLIMIATNKQAELKVQNILSTVKLPGKEKIQIYWVKDFLSKISISQSHPNTAKRSQ